MPKRKTRKRAIENTTDSGNTEAKPKQRCIKQNYNTEKESEIDLNFTLESSDNKVLQMDSENSSVKPKFGCVVQKHCNVEKESEIGSSSKDFSDNEVLLKDSENPGDRPKRGCLSQKHGKAKKESELGCSTKDSSESSEKNISQKDSEHPGVKPKRRCVVRKHCDTDEKESEIGSSSKDSSDNKVLQKDSENPGIKLKCSCLAQKHCNGEKECEIGSSSKDSSYNKFLQKHKKDSENSGVKPKRSCVAQKHRNADKKSKIGSTSKDSSENKFLQKHKMDSENPGVKPKRSCVVQKHSNAKKESEIGSGLKDSSDNKFLQKDNENACGKPKRSCVAQKHCNAKKESEICSSLKDSSDNKFVQKDNENARGKPKRSCVDQKHCNAKKESEIGSGLKDSSDNKFVQKDNENAHGNPKRSCVDQKHCNAKKESEIGSGLKDSSDNKFVQKDNENAHGNPKRSCVDQKHCNAKKESEIGSSLKDSSDNKFVQRDNENARGKPKRSCVDQKHCNAKKESEIGSSLKDSSNNKVWQKDSKNPGVKPKRSCVAQKHCNGENEYEIGSSSKDTSSSYNDVSHKEMESPAFKWKHISAKRKYYSIETASEICNTENDSEIGSSSKDNSDNKVSQNDKKDSEILDVKPQCCVAQKHWSTEKECKIGISSKDSPNNKVFQHESENVGVKPKHSCVAPKRYNIDNECEIGSISRYHSESKVLQKVTENPGVKPKCCVGQNHYSIEKECEISCSSKDTGSSYNNVLHKESENPEVKQKDISAKRKYCDMETASEIACSSRDMSKITDSLRNRNYSNENADADVSKPKVAKRTKYKVSTRVKRKIDRDRKRKLRAEMKQKLLDEQLNVDEFQEIQTEIDPECLDNVNNGIKSNFAKESYREHDRLYQMQKYNEDLEYREEKKLAARKKYEENLLYRQKKILDTSYRYKMCTQYRNSLKTASILKYRQNIQFRGQLKAVGIQRYRNNIKYRKRLKIASMLKYRSNIQHRKKKKGRSIKKYRDNIQHKEYVKISSICKYRDNSQHKENVKNASICKYRDNPEHKENVKNASKNKYRCNPEHKHRVDAYAKSQYRLHALYRKKKKDRLRSQYMRCLTTRSKKIQKVKKLRQQKIKNIGNIVEYFRKEVRNGPKHVCCVCHKFKFQKQVLICDIKKYKGKGRKQQLMANRCISDKYVCTCTDQCLENCELSNHNKLWICYTCHQHLLKGDMPVDATANNLDLQPIPEGLKNLNSLERQLLTLRLPFMKLVRLPKGGQNGVIGPCVSVPTDIQKTTSVLPHCEEDDKLVRVKLKRKIQYKGYHKYEYVSTNKLHKGIKYLQDNNQWYSAVALDTSWENPIEEEMHENGDTSDVHSPDVQNSLADPLHSNTDDANSDKEDDDPNQRDRGMPLDTCLQPVDIGQEILDQYFDEIFCVAPGEGFTPVSMLREIGNEAMTFPVQYPDGTGTYDDDRPIPLTRTRYFHSRLLNADNRFASDSNYLFYAQYLSELEQVISKVSIALRKGSAKDQSGNSVSAEMLTDPTKLKNLFKTDQGYKFLTPIRGTPPYWQATLKDLFAMIRQLGIPTWFCTFSAADMRWSEVLEVLLQQQGSTQSPVDLDWMEKCEVLRNNSVMNAIMFNHRFHTFLRQVIIRRQVIGKVKDHFHRIEFQLRGSPHSHCLFWIDGAPLLDEDDDETVCSFIDEYVTCKLPAENEDSELHEVVSSVQQHSKSHSKSCRKKGTTCRFHFPRPPSQKTFISRPQSLTDPSIELSPEQMINKAKDTLKTLWDVITNSDLQEITTQNIFNAAGISQEDFEEASNILTKRTSVVLERAPPDIWINQYNPTLIRCWNGNMDIQYVSDAYSCVMYIISYISKAEREMGMILEDARKEAAEGNLDASQTMKQIGSAYFRQREVSAQEAAYRVCGLHLKDASRKVQFIPVGDNPVRMSLPLNCIQQKSNTIDDEDIWMPTLSERYRARPISAHFNNMCLATFCSQYRILSTSQVPKDISQTPHVFQLQGNLGYIQKRTRTQAAVVRYPRFSVKKNSELYYLSILQLFLPHRTDKQLKPDAFANYEEFYSDGAVKLTSSSLPTSVRDIVEANRQHFEKNADALDDAQELAQKVGPLEDAWAIIGPEAESDRLECQMEKNTETSNNEEDISIPDLEMKQRKQKQDENIHIRTNIPSAQEITPLIQSLNSTQKQVFYTVRQWCLDKINGKNPKPFHLFITGGAGTGKSHLIKCISYQAHKILSPVSSSPDNTTVLLTAPTGVAAFNIGGTTLHQAFALPQYMSLPYQHLRDDKLNTLRSKLEDLKILIIDEISMVGQGLLIYVNERLRQIKQSKTAIFGNLCVITVGDFYQLPAVRQKCLYDIRPKNYCSLWFDNFSIIQLQEIMRQRDDSKFAELLNRLRVKTKQDALTADDFASLQACEDNAVDPEALHIFPTNAEVDEHNDMMINKVCDAFRCVFAEDFDKNPQNGRLTVRETPYETSADYLPSSIYLGRGARVMLIRNVDVSDGLVNGVMGTVGGILPPPPGSYLSSAVEVTFDNEKVGMNDRHKRQSNVVHIKPMEETLKNNAIRHQFPLRLAWACTVHKVQGITTDQAVVSLDKIFNAGMAYVALSRVTSIQGLTINNFNPDKIYSSEQISTALQEMPNFFPQPKNPVQISGTLNIFLHNVQGLIPHINDMRANTDLADSHFICLTETWMEQNTVKPAFNNYEFHHNPRSTSYSSNTPLFDKLKQQKHGGVGVFTASSQHFCQVHLQPCDIEVIAFQIRHLDIIVVVIYKPDSYTSSVFLQNLDKLLQQLPQDTAASLIMGDFNQDIMKQSSSVQNFMHNNGYKQLVKSSTTDGDTLIDHVYMKGNFETFVDVIPTYYSYHNMVSVKLRHQ